jgi:hypothetical protein
MNRFLPSFLFLFFIACNQQESANKKEKETISEKMIKKFNINKTELTQLVKIFQDNPQIDSMFQSEFLASRKAKEFPETFSKQLSVIGIEKVSIHQAKCPMKSDKKTFILETNWIAKDSVSIFYAVCDSIETKNGFYRKDDNGNEIWGIGESWGIVKIVKYLIVDQ